jgi:hypothetical protein
MCSGTPPRLHHAGPTMVARAWPRSSPRQLEDLRRPSASSRCFSFGRRLPDEWIDRSTLLGLPRGCIYDLGEPWGVLHLALHEIFLGREGNLVSKNQPRPDFPDSRPFLAGTISPTSGLQIMQIRCPNCMERNFLQLWYAFLSLETKIRSPNRPWKIICSDFGLTAQQRFRGSYLLAPLSELGVFGRAPRRFKKTAPLQFFSVKHTQLQQLHRGSAPEKRWSRPPTPWFSWSASRGTPPNPSFLELGEITHHCH